MERICTICARGGSKGVKGKNIRLLNGQPLLAHTIKQAQDSSLFDVIAVSSDSKKILEVAAQHGVEQLILRPEPLSTDKAAKIPAIRHAVQEVEKKLNITFEICVDLDATSPLRLSQDIIDAVEQFEKAQTGNLFSVCEAHRSPYFNMVERSDDGVVSLCKGEGSVKRRQDSPECYDMNASIYIWRRDVLEKEDILFLNDTDIYIMPVERSFDIDSEFDFKIVEFILSKNDINKESD